MAIDLETLREILKTELPRLLREHPETRYEIWGMMLETFPSRQEFASLSEELRAFRHETAQRFDNVDQRLDRMDQHFEQVDQRLDRMDQHFEQVDQRLDRMDQRFDQVDQRFEQVDQRFEQVDQRFNQVDQRFEQVDERFDQVDQRFEKVDERFEQVDRRFDELTAEMRQGFENLHRAIDRLGSRWGIRNESIFRQTIATLLEESFGVKVETRTIDGEQFDVIIKNGQHILVEIAASVGPKIQERLERKRRIYTEATGVEPTRVILATASIHSRRAHALRQAGFEVIEPEEDVLEETS
ncbi:MAG: DUF3782 domain-containing protein [Blastocatellia bacterium]|nr:DUF3782 domain-containing protein [Blastocatellia bacterium]